MPVEYILFTLMLYFSETKLMMVSIKSTSSTVLPIVQAPEFQCEALEVSAVLSGAP